MNHFLKVLVCVAILSFVKSDPIYEDSNLNVVQLLRKYGYEAEEYSVVTEDGYRLGIHRCPGGPLSPPRPFKPVVFLMHGQLSSSADYVIMGPQTSLVYMLADQGYDVWMGNSRGNRYSNTHVSLNNETKDFWDFSWHEIGTIDVPTMIDYVLGRTAQQKLHYVGHSMGTTVYFVMISEKPHYSSKIMSSQLLAPAAYMSNIITPYVKWIAAYAYTFELMYDMMGTYYFAPTDEMDRQAAYQDCQDGAPYQEMCANDIFMIAGWNSVETNRTMLPVINSHSPAGASVRNMLHYAQIVRGFYFRKYDHGANNIFIYGQTWPPLYTLTGHTAPTAFYYGLNDWMATPADVTNLYNSMGGASAVQRFYQVTQASFNHMDFVWAINVRSLVYTPMIEDMRRWE